MLFFIQMRWNIEGRQTLEEVFDKQVAEVSTNTGAGNVQMFKVAAQRRVLAIVEFDTAAELDAAFMAKLPLREYLELEEVWPIRPFAEFVEDCRFGFGTKDAVVG